MSSEAPCPDLVEQPGLTEGCKKSCPQLFSSLPDVSSIGRSCEVGILEDSAHKSTESLNFQPTGRLAEKPEMSDGDDDMDLGELDSELDAQLELNQPIGDQRIPDCIVESVMNEDHRGDELPVAFSESIKQRVRRERPSRRSGFDMLEPADLVKDTQKSDSEEKEKPKGAEGVEMESDGGNQMLDFLGDWPSEGSLGQRQVRRRVRNKEGTGEAEGVPQEANGNKTKVRPGPTEFQKLLDLIQTGEAASQTDSSRSSSISPSSEGESEEEEEAGGRSSNSETREQNVNRVDSSRGELPDCVLDWKAADSCKVRESRLDHWEALKTENEVISTRGGSDDVLEIDGETGSVDLKSANPTNPLSALIADSLVISKNVEANVQHDGAGGHSIEGEVGNEPSTGSPDVDTNDCTESDRENTAEADGSQISEVCQSPVCEGSVEADSSAFIGGSQERKQRQGRRSGKQCKLALTFTQNCPASQNTLECPNTTAQNMNSDLNSINTDVESNCNTSLEPNIDLFSEPKSEAHLNPSSPPLVDKGCSTQTEPQDFALLWRLNRQDNPDEAAITSSCQLCGIAILFGDSSRFVPEPSSPDSSLQSSGHREVPYRVVHEKGTQVEEKEVGTTQDRLESLRILSRHFKLVSFDTLEDLYDKCHQDLEWTTNLLLDSGERFFRDEDGEKEEEDGAWGEEDQNTSSLCGALGKPVETRLCPDVLDEQHPQDLPTGFEEGTQRSTCGTVSNSDEGANKANETSLGVPTRNKEILDATSKSPQTELLPQAVNDRERGANIECKVASEADLEGGARGISFDDGVIIEDSRIEIEEEIASMDEVHRMLQAELDQMEREERQKEEGKTERRHKEGRSRHLDIQSVELKLPTEVALQLTELFGPVGVDPGN